MVREIAWNGIAFAAPFEWDPAQVGMRHLLFEDDGRPVLELKWEKTRHHPSLSRQLQRLAAAPKEDGLDIFTEAPLPPKWQAALQGFEALGFTWKSRMAHGRGAALFCPACGHILFTRFFSPESESEAPVQLFASLRDHFEDGWVRWALFDIRAMTPERFRLAAHRFEPGRYEMVFETGGGGKLRFHRWAPASIFLRRRTLAQFALEQGLAEEPLVYAVNTEEIVEGSRPAPPAGARWPRTWRPAQSWVWFRIWHLVEKNRILSVSAAGKKPGEQAELMEICSRYETL